MVFDPLQGFATGSEAGDDVEVVIGLGNDEVATWTTRVVSDPVDRHSTSMTGVLRKLNWGETFSESCHKGNHGELARSQPPGS